MKGLLELGLSRLNITAYKDREHQNVIGSIQVMYNPDALDLRYSIDYDADLYLNGSMRSNHFRRAKPGELELKLLFDASLPGQTQTVESQLARLQLLCCQVEPSTMETPYLKVEWGAMHWHGKDYFSGRAASLNVNYSRFSRKATPLRATAHLTLIADRSQVLSKSELGDLVEQRAGMSVPDMSVLPMVASSIGAVVGAIGAYSYLTLAMANDLDSFDAIAPGDILVTPAASDTEET